MTDQSDRIVKKLWSYCQVLRDDGLSYQERSLCKRAIHLERLIEKRELTLALNGAVDEPGYFNAINALSGLYTKLGLKRRVKQLSLKDYLNSSKTEPPSAPIGGH